MCLHDEQIHHLILVKGKKNLYTAIKNHTKKPELGLSKIFDIVVEKDYAEDS